MTNYTEKFYDALENFKDLVSYLTATLSKKVVGKSYTVMSKISVFSLKSKSHEKHLRVYNYERKGDLQALTRHQAFSFIVRHLIHAVALGITKSEDQTCFLIMENIQSAEVNYFRTFLTLTWACELPDIP